MKITPLLFIKDKYLPLLAQGRILISGAMTESGAGSNPRAMVSKANYHNEHSWLLSGSKRWVGMAAWAELIAIYVQQYDADQNWLGNEWFHSS